MSVWVEKKSDKTPCRKWLARVEVSQDGKRKRKSFTFVGTKRDALKEARKLEDELSRLTDSGTFANFSNQWNDSRYGIGAIEKQTYRQYAHLFNGLSLHIGDKKMDEIAPRDVESALAALKSGQTPSGKPWSGTTLRAAYKACNNVMGEAVKRGLCLSNPCLAVNAPKSDTKRRKALTLEESADLLEKLEGEGAQGFACALMIRTGIRAGECVGLLWADVRDGCLCVPRSITKSDSGERRIPLDEGTLALIEKRRSFVSEFLGRFEHRIEPDTQLICTKDGRPLTYNALKKWWQRNQERLDMEGWTLHELRHTYATNLAQAGVHPAIMAALLGHASSEITMEIYTHIQNQDLRDASEKLAKARLSSK